AVKGTCLDVTYLRETEAQARETEENYRYTIELSPQIPWTADRCGNLTEISPRWSEIIGMSNEETHGLGWAAALHPDDAIWALPAWRASVLSGEPFDTRLRLKRVSGEYSWFRARARPRRDEKNQIIRWYGVAEDVHEQVRAENALTSAEERYRLATQATNDLIWDFDPATNRVEWTRSLVNVFGYPAEELGTNTAWWEDHIHPEDRAATLGCFHRALGSNEQQFVHEYRFRRADGSYATVFDRGYVVRDEQGHAVRAVGAMQDLTGRKLAEEAARWGANHDFLTELPNRRLFHRRLEQALACAAARNTQVALLHLDVDHFKAVNDTWGHGAGDELLRTLAFRLREVIRSSDTIARLGGDEFAIILGDVGDAEDLPSLVQTILDRMREPFSYDGRILDCRTSIGASVYPLHGQSSEELLKNADTALYSAKLAGRGGLMVFQPEMREEVAKRSLMVSRARDAVTHDLVFPYYQPKMDLRTGHVNGFEALLRWRDPAGELQSPKEILAAFEDLELAEAISERMLERTLRDAITWLDAGVPFGHIAVNAAAAEFRQDNFAERVLEKLGKASLPTSRFQIEVTETVFLGRGAENVERSLNLLSREGVTIALDDFGTGYASLRHLKQFPVDVLKIDRSFVQGLQNGLGDAAIIEAVLKLGQSLRISTVAEGVETAAQADHLRSRGCDFGQGFLYSPAVPAERVPSLITSLGAIHSRVGTLQATADHPLDARTDSF
ncbi:putative bifunctional diguanylate cyclase/phosphodiesterase, partial [Altericroceibacterium xinjiangense]|uniref:putative bifunctional diguanylate cyclase/phosphodiesterase n=1 Tax=Altericroceibacterium xinjiangense TaxID=762261 RepID=UPI0013DE91AC